MRKAEIIVGIGAIGLALVFLYISGSFPQPRGQDVGMGFSPRVLVGLIIFFSLIIIFQAITKKRAEDVGRRSGAGPEENEATQEPLFDTKEGGVKRVLILIGLTLVYQQIIGVAGFIVVTPIYLIVLMLVFEAAALWRILLISLTTTAVIYIAFQRLLKIPLPTGVFYN